MEKLKAKVAAALETETDEAKIKELKHVLRHCNYGLNGTEKESKDEAAQRETEEA